MNTPNNGLRLLFVKYIDIVTKSYYVSQNVDKIKQKLHFHPSHLPAQNPPLLPVAELVMDFSE